MYIHVHSVVCIYIYIDRKREREREREGERERELVIYATMGAFKRVYGLHRFQDLGAWGSGDKGS